MPITMKPEFKRVTDEVSIKKWGFYRRRGAQQWTSDLVVSSDLDGPLKGWRSEIEWHLTEGAEPELREVRLRPIAQRHWHDVPTQAALRTLRHGSLRRDLLEWLGRVPADKLAILWIDAIHRSKRSGRAGTQDRTYAIWAVRRVEAQNADPRRPIKWMANRWGESDGAINMLVFRAKERGMLSGNPPVLTDLARRHLGSAD
jgi:hypothetical protein